MTKEPMVELGKVDRGLAAEATELVRSGYGSGFARFCGLVARRISMLERERDNLYALASSKFERGELDQLLQASRRGDE